jgi:hypothetical protein
MYQDTRHYCTLALTVLLSIPRSNAQSDRMPTSEDPDHQLQESFVQYPTEGGTLIVAKPLEKAAIDNPGFEDYVHVVVACTLALLLATLLGLFIRHYGLTLPPLTRSERSKPKRTPAGDAENDPQTEASRGVVGMGIDKWEKEGLESLPEKPAAVHLKWG